MDNVSSWIYLAVTSFSFTPFFGAGDSFGILLVIFVEYFNETNSKIGWVGSIKGSLGCAVYPFVVYLHRRFGFLTIVISAAFIGSFCYIATPFIPSANYLFFTYSIPLGLSIGLLDCVTIITIRDYFDKYLGVATGLRFSSISIGAITFNYLMPILIEAVGWKKTFFCLSSLGGVILIYALGYRIAISNKKLQPRTLLDEKRNVEAGDEICQKTRPENSHGSLRNKEFWLVLIASIPFGFVIAVPAMFTVRR